ncbi:hypothetical protein [Sinisalibacter aestuarii]|uniref:Cyanovirin-N domain-containing protein n=1 Tax=Sinisalibacter aestuarii TaxID=2949426 RepID=A0ABQ5LTB7_9RHOB|nr:hypothetical protein [Sinisalibacter aestuarii]GKY87858.1 hypothetical protein STA1M1_17270 [Sinisalibacter aestuarii]
MRWMMIALVSLPGAAPADVTGPGGRVIDCYCTDSTGGRVELEEEICLTVDGRAFIARCEMSLNNPIWRDTGRACLSSSLAPLQCLEPPRGAGGVDAHISLAEHKV